MSQTWQKFILEQSLTSPKLRNVLSQTYLLQGKFSKAAEAREIEDELLNPSNTGEGDSEEEMSEEEIQALQALEEAAQSQEGSGDDEYEEDSEPEEDYEEDGDDEEEMSEEEAQAMQMLEEAALNQQADEADPSGEEYSEEGPEDVGDGAYPEEEAAIDPEELSEEEIEQILNLQG